MFSLESSEDIGGGGGGGGGVQDLLRPPIDTDRITSGVTSDSVVGLLTSATESSMNKVLELIKYLLKKQEIFNVSVMAAQYLSQKLQPAMPACQ